MFIIIVWIIAVVVIQGILVTWCDIINNVPHTVDEYKLYSVEAGKMGEYES